MTDMGPDVEQEARKLAGAEGLIDDRLKGVQLWQASISSYDAGTKLATITLGGDTTPIVGVAHLASYTPDPADTGVWVAMIGTTPLLVGAVGAAGAGAGEPHVGSYSGTTDASAFLVVTHGAGFTPSAVMLQSYTPNGGANQGYPVVTAVGATTFTMRYMVSAGTTSSISVSGRYVCFP